MTSTPEPTSPDIVAPALTLAIGKLIRRVRADSDTGGLSVSETATLALLDEHGPMSNAELARAETMKPQSMNTILGGLARDGLVERRPHPTDGRQILFSLTPKGLEARRQWRMTKQDWLAAAVARLDPADRQTLLTAARLIHDLSTS